MFGRLAAAALLFSTASAMAAGETRDLVFATRDLDAETRHIAGETRDLVFLIEDVIKVTETSEEITIALPADILFDFDKADIRPDAAAALSSAADLLRQGVKGAVTVAGHTDAKGSDDYNLKLSEKRAESVKAWLVEQGGLGDLEFRLEGHGEARPVAPNAAPDGADDPAGRQRNRRVEIVYRKA